MVRRLVPTPTAPQAAPRDQPLHARRLVPLPPLVLRGATAWRRETRSRPTPRRATPAFAALATAAAGGWRGPESNWRHHDFQSCALPTELPRLCSSDDGIYRWGPMEAMRTRTRFRRRQSARRAGAQRHAPLPHRLRDRRGGGRDHRHGARLVGLARRSRWRSRSRSCSATRSRACRCCAAGSRSRAVDSDRARVGHALDRGHGGRRQRDHPRRSRARWRRASTTCCSGARCRSRCPSPASSPTR